MLKLKMNLNDSFHGNVTINTNLMKSRMASSIHKLNINLKIVVWLHPSIT